MIISEDKLGTVCPSALIVSCKLFVFNYSGKCSKDARRYDICSATLMVEEVSICESGSFFFFLTPIGNPCVNRNHPYAHLPIPLSKALHSLLMNISRRRLP